VTQSPVADSKRTPFRVYLLGFGVTGTFYSTVPFIPGIESFVRRYFCSHPIEIASTVLFFTGMTVLLHRLWRMRSEQSAAAAIELAADTDDGLHSESLTKWCEAQPERLQNSAMLERIGGAVRYVAGSGREGLEQHLRYLAELAADRLHESYALVRTITWAIPILGFLGTVHGITIAIANLTPEQLDESLPEVVGGLEAAFDTTALALAMSIVLVFTAFKTERSEQGILNLVERFGINRILPRFTVADSLRGMTIPNDAQWNKQCEQLQTTWTDTLNDHFAMLSEHLESEVDSTLSTHRDSAHQANLILTKTMQDSAAVYAETVSASMNHFSQRIEQWQKAMIATSTSAAEQTEAIHNLGRTLLQMHKSEERLANLQSQLNDNLQAVQTAEALEEAVSSLSAAVNLLTTKTSHRAAA
jgi:biopolymer transport protein ExbB/TolQ